MDESAKGIHALAVERLKKAWDKFNIATGVEMVDSAIYEILSAEIVMDTVIRESREKRLHIPPNDESLLSKLLSKII